MQHHAQEENRGFSWGSCLLTLAGVIAVIVVLLLILLAWFNHRIKEEMYSSVPYTGTVTVTEASTTLPAPDGLSPELERVLDRSLLHDAQLELSVSYTEATVFSAETTEQSWEEPSALAAHITELAPLLCDSFFQFTPTERERPTIVVKHPCAQELSPEGLAELLTLAGDSSVEIALGQMDPDLPLHDAHIGARTLQYQELVDKLRGNPAALTGSTIAVTTDNDITVVEIK